MNKKWIVVYNSRDWTHAWVVVADTEKQAKQKASLEIREAFTKGVFGTAQVNADWGEWLMARPFSESFLETVVELPG